MPGKDGIELCRRFRGLPKPIKPYLIFVTARARTQDIVTGLTAGADDYIVKPFQRGELHPRVPRGERPPQLPATPPGRAEKLEDAADPGHLLHRAPAVRSYLQQ